jgi:endonuclease-8
MSFDLHWAGCSALMPSFDSIGPSAGSKTLDTTPTRAAACWLSRFFGPQAHWRGPPSFAIELLGSSIALETDLVVRTGTTLRLSSTGTTVVIGPHQIRVEPGARLELDGLTLADSVRSSALVVRGSAAALRTALVGKPVVRFDAPRLDGPKPKLGRVIELVESHGKHLEILWDDGLVLHTHMRMSGSWHLYRTGERWRKPDHQMRVAIEVEDWVAVCFNAPIVETFREFDMHRHPGFGRLGPDLCTAPVAELEECARRIYDYAEPTMPIAEVLLDQHVACGVGNVYRAEVLHLLGIHPDTPAKEIPPETARAMARAPPWVGPATSSWRSAPRHRSATSRTGTARSPDARGI